MQGRIRWVAVGNIVVYGGTTYALYNTWYRNYPQSPFHFFNDNAEWLQMDKAGHAWSAYSEGRAGIALWRWAGLSNKKAVWVGGLSGLAYQSIIEVLDGFSSQWGFSWGDYLANTMGSALLISQELGWKEQRISLKFSFHPVHYTPLEVQQRADNLFGTTLAEQTLKDYNGQSYWLSANLKSLITLNGFPSWLNLSVGYGAENMLGALNNIWVSKSGALLNYSAEKRYRQFLLAPDIDLTKISTKSRMLKTVFFLFNSLKVPTPALEFSRGRFHWNWLYF